MLPDPFLFSSIVLFLVLFLGRSLWLRVVHGVRPFRAMRRPGLLEWLLVVGLPLFTWEALAVSAGWPPLVPTAWNPVLFSHPVAVWTGRALILGGLALFAAALWSFGRSWRVGIDREAPGALVTEGVFGWSRNPIFVFMDALVLGTFLCTGHGVFGLLALATVAGIHFQILAEERFLAMRYGPAYARYRDQVPRYLGRVRARP